VKERFPVLRKYGFLFSIHGAHRGRIREEEPVLLHALDFKDLKWDQEPP